MNAMIPTRRPPTVVTIASYIPDESINAIVKFIEISGTTDEKIEKLQISISHFEERNSVKRTEENVFCKDSTATQATLRRWFIKGDYVPYKCDCCGISHIKVLNEFENYKVKNIKERRF